MKIRKGFVSNSSSSSFIINIHSAVKNVDDFIKTFNDFLAEHIENKSWQDGFVQPQFLTPEKVEQSGPNDFIIKEFMPFYNSPDDLPEYIKELKSDDPQLLKEIESKYGMKNRGLRIINNPPKDENGDTDNDESTY
ncbi:MAG: hypothetical protein WCQ99_03445 [Pseudomonadota bacterium]